MLSLIPRFSPWPYARPLPTEIPGPALLAAGTTQLGWYGEVSDAALIAGSALATQLGLTAGVAINPNAGWLKFSHLGKILFVAKKTIRSTVSWNHLNAVNAIFGTRILEIGAHKYRIRLLKGGNADPASASGGEWNDLIYRVHANDPTNTNWAAYTDAQLFVGQNGAGSFSWCQEADAQDPSKKTGRGMASLTHWMRDNPIENNVNGANAYQSWRPVLEYVGPIAPEYDPNLWLQYTFPDDEPINDVTERFITLAGVSAIKLKSL